MLWTSAPYLLTEVCSLSRGSFVQAGVSQWYCSNGNDYENGNTLTVVNENENDVYFQNKNNIENKNDVLQNL